MPTFVTARLALYGLAGAALLAILIGAGLKVRAWHSASLRLPAVEAERDAAIIARSRAETDIARQVANNQEIERALTERVVAADARARELARRLLAYASLSRPVCPTTAAAGRDDGAGRDARQDRAVEAAVAELIAAADRDAARLTGLQAYVKGLPARCVPD